MPPFNNYKRLIDERKKAEEDARIAGKREIWLSRDAKVMIDGESFRIAGFNGVALSYDYVMTNGLQAEIETRKQEWQDWVQGRSQDLPENNQRPDK